jgi:hypothetical protein
MGGGTIERQDRDIRQCRDDVFYRCFEFSSLAVRFQKAATNPEFRDANGRREKLGGWTSPEPRQNAAFAARAFHHLR